MSVKEAIPLLRKEIAALIKDYEGAKIEENKDSNKATLLQRARDIDALMALEEILVNAIPRSISKNLEAIANHIATKLLVDNNEENRLKYTVDLLSLKVVDEASLRLAESVKKFLGATREESKGWRVKLVKKILPSIRDKINARLSILPPLEQSIADYQNAKAKNLGEQKEEKEQSWNAEEIKQQVLQLKARFDSDKESLEKLRAETAQSAVKLAALEAKKLKTINKRGAEHAKIGFLEKQIIVLQQTLEEQKEVVLAQISEQDEYNAKVKALVKIPLAHFHLKAEQLNNKLAKAHAKQLDVSAHSKPDTATASLRGLEVSFTNTKEGLAELDVMLEDINALLKELAALSVFLKNRQEEAGIEFSGIKELETAKDSIQEKIKTYTQARADINKQLPQISKYIEMEKKKAALKEWRRLYVEGLKSKINNYIEKRGKQYWFRDFLSKTFDFFFGWLWRGYKVQERERKKYLKVDVEKNLDKYVEEGPSVAPVIKKVFETGLTLFSPRAKKGPQYQKSLKYLLEKADQELEELNKHQAAVSLKP